MKALETDKEVFEKRLREFSRGCTDSVSTKNGEWIVKGFIDVAKKIYTVSVDTKVVSKVMELLLFPGFFKFAKKYDYKIQLTEHQNHYPDLTFMQKNGTRFAVDLKTTYRVSPTDINGMTLGAFTGYFRDRKSGKNTTHPYGSYAGHFVFALIYSRVDGVDEKLVYKLKDLEKILSVIKDFEFFVQEKYRIAIDRPGSGNTKNIGSINKINDLLEGNGPFSKLGVEIFDDYWMNYLTSEMARAAELKAPIYKNLREYLAYRGKV